MSTLLDPQLNPQPPVNDVPDANTEREETKPVPGQPEPRPNESDGANEPPPDAPVCRICLMNADEAPELGRLIRPCLCRGTVGHVHIQCLNQWRKASSSRKAFWQCDQCGYKYQLVRTRALGIAQSRLVVGVSTLTLFTLIVFAVSFFVSLFLPSEWIDGTPSTVARLVDQSVDDQMNSWYGGSWWYYSSSGFTNSMWKVAYQALNDIFDDALFPQQQEPARESTSYRYKATSRRAAKQQPRVKVARQAVPVDARRGEGAGPFKSTVAVPRTAAEKPTRLQREMDELYDDDDLGPPPRPGFLARMVRRFLLGLSVVGAFSFMTFGWSVTFPLQWVRRRAAGNRRGEARDSYGIIVLLMILIGAAKAMYSTYQLTQTLSTELLRRAETAILEVGTNEAVPLEEPMHPFRFTRDRLRQIGKHEFWRELWWSSIRWLRGAKDSVVEFWNLVRQEVNWRDLFAALGALLFALFGGGFWFWQF